MQRGSTSPPKKGLRSMSYQQGVRALAPDSAGSDSADDGAVARVQMSTEGAVPKCAGGRVVQRKLAALTHPGGTRKKQAFEGPPAPTDRPDGKELAKRRVFADKLIAKQLTASHIAVLNAAKKLYHVDPGISQHFMAARTALQEAQAKGDTTPLNSALMPVMQVVAKLDGYLAKLVREHGSSLVRGTADITFDTTLKKGRALQTQVDKAIAAKGNKRKPALSGVGEAITEWESAFYYDLNLANLKKDKEGSMASRGKLVGELGKLEKGTKLEQLDATWSFIDVGQYDRLADVAKPGVTLHVKFSEIFKPPVPVSLVYAIEGRQAKLITAGKTSEVVATVGVGPNPDLGKTVQKLVNTWSGKTDKLPSGRLVVASPNPKKKGMLAQATFTKSRHWTSLFSQWVTETEQGKAWAQMVTALSFASIGAGLALRLGAAMLAARASVAAGAAATSTAGAFVRGAGTHLVSKGLQSVVGGLGWASTAASAMVSSIDIYGRAVSGRKQSLWSILTLIGVGLDVAAHSKALKKLLGGLTKVPKTKAWPVALHGMYSFAISSGDLGFLGVSVVKRIQAYSNIKNPTPQERIAFFKDLGMAAFNAGLLAMSARDAASKVKHSGDPAQRAAVREEALRIKDELKQARADHKAAKTALNTFEKSKARHAPGGYAEHHRLDWARLNAEQKVKTLKAQYDAQLGQWRSLLSGSDPNAALGSTVRARSNKPGSPQVKTGGGDAKAPARTGGGDGKAPAKTGGGDGKAPAKTGGGDGKASAKTGGAKAKGGSPKTASGSNKADSTTKKGAGKAGDGKTSNATSASADASIHAALLASAIAREELTAARLVNWLISKMNMAHLAKTMGKYRKTVKRTNQTIDTHNKNRQVDNPAGGPMDFLRNLGTPRGPTSLVLGGGAIKKIQPAKTPAERLARIAKEAPRNHAGWSHFLGYGPIKKLFDSSVKATAIKDPTTLDSFYRSFFKQLRAKTEAKGDTTPAISIAPAKLRQVLTQDPESIAQGVTARLEHW